MQQDEVGPVHGTWLQCIMGTVLWGTHRALFLFAVEILVVIKDRSQWRNWRRISSKSLNIPTQCFSCWLQQQQLDSGYDIISCHDWEYPVLFTIVLPLSFSSLGNISIFYCCLSAECLCLRVLTKHSFTQTVTGGHDMSSVMDEKINKPVFPAPVSLTPEPKQRINLKLHVTCR